MRSAIRMRVAVWTRGSWTHDSRELYRDRHLTGSYCTDGASRKPAVNGRRASTKAGAASLLPVMCCCQILAIRRCLCLRRSRSTSTTSRRTSTTAPGMPASKATGSHDGDEGPADGGVLGGLGPEPASLCLSAPMFWVRYFPLLYRAVPKPTMRCSGTQGSQQTIINNVHCCF